MHYTRSLDSLLSFITMWCGSLDVTPSVLISSYTIGILSGGQFPRKQT